MVDRYFNPFQALGIRVPVEFHEAFKRYCHRGNHIVIDESPFPRMIDFWFLSLCVACNLGLKPSNITKHKTVKIIDGAIFASDPWRIHTLMLIAISKENGDVSVVSKPRKMLSIANGLAMAGISEVIKMLKRGHDVPIWNLSDAVDELLRNDKTV